MAKKSNSRPRTHKSRGAAESIALPPDQTIVRRMAVPGVAGLYVLGCFERPATVHMQQCRALNLIWALKANDKLQAGQRIAVVGGGVGGLTAAAAACLLGGNITLFEKHGDLLPIQRGNHTRFLHPHIYDWPAAHSEELETVLPLMNWTAGLAGEVAAQLLLEWTNEFDSHPEMSVKRNTEITGYVPDNQRLLLTCTGPNGFDAEAFDLVLLSVGFGIERNHEPLPFNSYWHDDNLHQPVLRKNLPRRFLVSGCGDGGLIDALRLQVDGFKHGDIHKLSEILRTSDDVDEIKRELLRIDEEAAALAGNNRSVPVFLFEQYKRLNLSPRLKEKRPSNRHDTLVHLHDRSSLTPLTLQSAILNRLMVFILVHYRGMQFHRGEVDWDQVTWERGRGYRVEFQNGPRKHVEYYDEIICRHGPEPAMDDYFPEIRPLIAHKQLPFLDPTRQRLWPEEFHAALAERLVERQMVTRQQRQVRAVDRAHAVLSADTLLGSDSLESLMQDATMDATAGKVLLDRVDFNWTKTRYKQVLHRLKLFFALREKGGAATLIAEIQRERWPVWLFAAECFDYFSDHDVRMEAANQLMGAVPKSSAALLDRPDGARAAITALGYLGIPDWRYKILDVLRDSKHDPDQKFRSYSLTAAGLLLEKADKESLEYLDSFLQRLLYGFGAGEFSPAPAPVENRELYWLVKRTLGRRKQSLGADHFHQALRRDARDWDPEGFVRGCYAHILGTLALPHTIPALVDVILSETVEDLRFECARSLARMRLPEATNALVEIIPQLNNRQVKAIAQLSLVGCAHLADRPSEALRMILDQWHPEAYQPTVLRAIGLCRAAEYLDRIELGLNSSSGEVRGQAALAKVRLGQAVDGLASRIASPTEHVESILLILADLLARGQSDIVTFTNCIEKELFEWSGLVVEDLRSITCTAPAEFRQLLAHWEPLLQREAENLKYLYG